MILLNLVTTRDDDSVELKYGPLNQHSLSGEIYSAKFFKFPRIIFIKRSKGSDVYYPYRFNKPAALKLSGLVQRGWPPTPTLALRTHAHTQHLSIDPSCCSLLGPSSRPNAAAVGRFEVNDETCFFRHQDSSLKVASCVCTTRIRILSLNHPDRWFFFSCVVKNNKSRDKLVLFLAFTRAKQAGKKSFDVLHVGCFFFITRDKKRVT